MTSLGDFDDFLTLAVPSTPPPPPPLSASSFPLAPSTYQDHDHDSQSQLEYHHSSIGHDSTTTAAPKKEPVLSPIHLVALSNVKLNNDLYSNRSLSIHKRILVKNLLTLIYQLNPPLDWAQYAQDQVDAKAMLQGHDSQHQQQHGQGDEDKNGGHGKDEKAMPVVSIPSRSSSAPPPSYLPKAPNTDNSSNSSNSSNSTNNNTGASTKGASPSDTALAVAAAVPLPRPKSAELPQSLHSYLSTVFDVDWSVGLPNTEDSLFTHAPPTIGLSSLNGGGVPSSMASKRKSLTSGLSSVTSASTATAPSLPERVSTSSTMSSFSSLSTASSATSVSSAGSTTGGGGSGGASLFSAGRAGLAGLGLSFMKQQDEPERPLPPPKDNDNSVSTGNVATGGSRLTPTVTLVRKSSLQSNQARSRNDNNQTNGASTSTKAMQTNDNSTSAATTATSPNMSSDGRIVPTRKASISGATRPRLVPGRRSSLLPPGQLPVPVSPPLSAHSTNNTYSDRGAQDGPQSRSQNSTIPQDSGSSSFLSPPSSSFAPSYSPSTSPATSPTKATFSKRTSSLPAERPRHAARTPSSENTLAGSSSYFPATSTISGPNSSIHNSGGAVTTSVAIESIIGLPRPLLSGGSMSGSSLLSSSPPPSPSTMPASGSGAYSPSPYLQQQQQQLQPVSPPPSYARSFSDDPSGWRSPSPAPSSSSTLPTPPSSPGYHSNLPRPQPTYMLKASKSSPCLVSSNRVESEDEDHEVPAIPFQHVVPYTPSTRYIPQPKPPSPQMQQRQQQPSHTAYPYSESSGYQGQQSQHQHQQYQQQQDPSASSQASTGFKLLARSSSRRAGSSPSVPTDNSVKSSSSSSGALNISAPLPLIPTHQNYNHYDPYIQHGQGSGSGNGRDLGGYGHGHSQSMVNLGSLPSSSSQQYQQQHQQVAKTPSPTSTLGRWNSMKMILGLRVGQGSSSSSPSSLSR